jgi:CubicO group peptidase (beta-lactamase class C family)
MKNINLLVFLSLLFASQFILAQNPDSDLDYYSKRKMEKARVIGMQLGYIKKDGTTWIGSYGELNKETGQKINDSTLFMIASCSKPITALAILKLYNDKKLDLDSDINKYLPFKITNPHNPEVSITARMLLAHTSSIKDNWEIMDPLYTLDSGGDSPIRLVDFISDYFMKNGKYYDANENFFNEQSGKYWEYSNMGYALLGLIIEEVSGKSFNTYMKEEIFKPLEMNNSYWFLKDIPTQNIARPHDLPENKMDSIKVLKHYGFPDFPDGQLRTTTKDYLKFIQLILNKGRIKDSQFIDEKIIELFHKVQYPKIHKHQAIAFNYNEFENFLYYIFMKRLPSHTGGDPGVATVVSYDIEYNVAAVVFMNSPPKTFKGGKILYLDLPKKLLKEAKK